MRGRPTSLAIIQAVIAATALGLALAGCNNHDDTGPVDGGVDRSDLGARGDLSDVTPLPQPQATHVGVTGLTCCLVTSGDRAAYVTAADAAGLGHGELRVAGSDGSDAHVAMGVPPGGFVFSPDGRRLLWLQPTARSRAGLGVYDLANKTATLVIPDGLQAAQPLLAQGFFSPDARFFLAGVQPANVGRSADLTVVDVAAAAVTYHRGNGAWDYLQLVLADGTLVFQDTAGGTAGGPPPVQTLYWIALADAATMLPTTIATRVSSFDVDATQTRLLFLRTDGNLFSYDLATRSGSPTEIASGAVRFSVGPGRAGPLAYIGSDGSVRVVGFDGVALTIVRGDDAAAAGLTSPLGFAPRGDAVYYYRDVEQQAARATLARLPVAPGARPALGPMRASLRDLAVVPDGLVLLDDVDDLGRFGQAVHLDAGGSVRALGAAHTPVGGLVVVAPDVASWSAARLTGAHATVDLRVDGSAALVGALALIRHDQVGPPGGGEAVLDAAVAAGGFAFDVDRGRVVAFIGGAAFDAAAGNFVGSLSLVATRAPMSPVPALAGVSEIGPIVRRAFFVNAPKASPAGLYRVQF